jgi:hypothetical protein
VHRETILPGAPFTNITRLPCSPRTTLEYFLAESKDSNETTFSFEISSAAPDSFKNTISARSVLFPPITAPLQTDAPLLTPIPANTDEAKGGGSSLKDANVPPSPTATDEKLIHYILFSEKKQPQT